MSVRSMLAVVITASLAVAQEPEWIQNFADAKAKAAKENKDLLIDFTGSDWCIWCKRLDSEVFAQDDFKTGIAKGFVLVKLDYPRDKNLVTDEIRAQNEKLQAEWQPAGFPTVFLADAAGRPYAQTGYQEGGATKYLDHVAELQKNKTKRDEAMAKADKAKGVDRAKALDEAVEGLGEELAINHYKSMIEEIIALDAKDEAKLKSKYASKLDDGEQKKIADEVQRVFGEHAQGGDWDAANKAMDEMLAKHKGRKIVEQIATFHKAIAAIEGKKDFDSALKLMDAAKDIAPDSELGKNIPRIKGRVEKMRDEAKKEAGDGKKEEEGKKEEGGK